MALGNTVRPHLPSSPSLGIGHLVRFDTGAKGNASHILVNEIIQYKAILAESGTYLGCDQNILSVGLILSRLHL